MKLLKKLLALTLVGVLALTLLTGCSDSSSADIPEDNIAASYVQALNNGAEKYTDPVLPTLYYSASLSDVTANKLNVWLRWINNEDAVDTEEKRDDLIDAIEDKCKAEKKYESVAVVVSEGDRAPDYKELYEKTDAYCSADKVAIIRIKNEVENGGDGKTYTMIELYKDISK